MRIERLNMPNGTNQTSEDWENVKRFFSAISEPLTDFASKYNLLIQKYYHESDSWDFLFRHPKGCVGKIQFNKGVKEGEVRLSGMWWIDNYHEGIRSEKSSKVETYKVQSASIQKILKEKLTEIIQWKIDDLSEVKQRYGNWKKIPKEEFENEINYYPLPKIR
jgi:hypothetical protein